MVMVIWYSIGALLQTQMCLWLHETHGLLAKLAVMSCDSKVAMPAPPPLRGVNSRVPSWALIQWRRSFCFICFFSEAPSALNAAWEPGIWGTKAEEPLSHGTALRFPSPFQAELTYLHALSLRGSPFPVGSWSLVHRDSWQACLTAFPKCLDVPESYREPGVGCRDGTPATQWP